MVTQDLASVVVRAQQGDQQAFDEIYNTQHSAIIKYLRRRPGVSAALAEDLAQDIFLKAFQNIHNFRGDATLSTWIMRIAINVLSSYRRVNDPFRNGTLYSKIDDIFEVGLSIPDESATPDEVLLGNDLEKRVERKITKMSPLDAQALMAAREGLNQKKSAAILGIPVGTLKSKLHRGRTYLAQELAGDYPQLSRYLDQ